jgi:hypothetical protein
MNEVIVERRSGTDRRVNRTLNLRPLLLGGRREHGRRKEDRDKTFLVDRYNPLFLAAITGILFLSVIDALLTLFLISRGAFELNPVMAFYIELGPYSFLAVKYALTCVGVISFLLLRNIYIRPFGIYTGSLFYIVLAVFGTVVVWELFLVAQII